MCHCGQVVFELSQSPKWLVECNCSICQRMGALWGHLDQSFVSLPESNGATIEYIHGDKTLAMHSCQNCGCTTHWLSLNPEVSTRMAVNFRMCSASDRARLKIRPFDGAKTWEFLD